VHTLRIAASQAEVLGALALEVDADKRALHEIGGERRNTVEGRMARRSSSTAQ